MKVKFPNKVKRLYIPFLLPQEYYQRLLEEVKKIEYPKSVKNINVSAEINLDLKGPINYKLAQVTLNR